MSEQSERMKVASNALLAEALAFYADSNNWRSPSSGFAAQYDPEPSPVQCDSGQRARRALQANEQVSRVSAAPELTPENFRTRCPVCARYHVSPSPRIMVMGPNRRGMCEITEDSQASNIPICRNDTPDNP